MGQDDVLYTAQSDIRDYFYSIGLPTGLRRFFCLPQVDLRSIVPHHELCLRSKGPVLVHPAMKVVPMGWNWAMYIAQRVHQHQAMLAAEVDMSRVLVDARPPPPLSRAGKPILVPYADNLNVIGVDAKVVQETKQKVVEHLHKIGFRTHEEEDATAQAESLGIDGVAGEVYPKPNKREKVRKVLLWLAIEKVIGHCIHFFMVKRELLSIFRALYDFKAAHYEHRVKLWPSAAQECKWAAALLLMCRANLRLPWHPSVTASDASLTGTGVVEAVFDPKLVSVVGSQKELWRYKATDLANKAREHVSKLDPFADAGTVCEQKPRDSFDEFQLNLDFQEVPAEMLDKSKWHTLFSTHMKKPEHITLLEGRAVVQAVRHKARAIHNFHHRHLHLGDNLGMTLSFDRGRAKNKALLFQCRMLTAYSLATNSEFHHRWIPSECNAADEPSRIYEKSFQPSKKGKRVILQKNLQEVDQTDLQGQSKTIRGHSKPESHCETICGFPTFAATGRDQASYSRSRCWSETNQEIEAHGRAHRTGKEPISILSRTSSSISENCTGLSLQDGCVQPVLSLAQANNPNFNLYRCSPGHLLRAVFQRWHGYRRSHEISSSHPRQSPRSGATPHAATCSSSPSRLEESGSWDNKAAVSLASHSTDCRQDAAIKVDECGHVHPYHVRYLLPTFRTFQAGGKRSGNDCLHGNQVVSGNQQVRHPRNIEDGDDRRNNLPRQQRDALVGRPTSRVSGKNRDLKNVQPGVPRVHGCMETSSTTTRASKKLCRALSAEAQRGFLGSPEATSDSARGQVQRPMEDRRIHGKVRETCHGYAEVRRAPKNTPKAGPASSTSSQAVGPKVLLPKGRPVTRGTCLELFSGTGRLSRKLCTAGFRVEAWDIMYSSTCDLCNVSTLNSILDRIRKGKIAYVHVGLPCSTWSRARRWDGRGPGPLRDDLSCLMGMPRYMLSTADQNKLAIGNRLFYHSMRIIRQCNKYGVPWTLENPMTSRVWLTRQVQLLKRCAQLWRADFCQYGEPWRKATYFLASQHFVLNFRQCKGSHGICSRTGMVHIPLQGTDDHGRFLTKVAEPYPFALAKQLATAVLKLHSSRRP